MTALMMLRLKYVCSPFAVQCADVLRQSIFKPIVSEIVKVYQPNVIVLQVSFPACSVLLKISRFSGRPV
jgi:hypothetical protein